jgi:hypothetical protein
MWLTGFGFRWPSSFTASHLAHFTLGLTHAADVQITRSGEAVVSKNYLDLTEMKESGKSAPPRSK